MTKINSFKPRTSLMKNFFTAMGAFTLLAGTGIVVSLINPPAAVAQFQSAKSIVDEALSQGVIGETVSGYLAPVEGAVVSQAVRNAMNEINIGRKAAYTRLARDKNSSIEVVAALTGEKLVGKAPTGRKVLDRSGEWRTK